jgi:hypothetical protein
MNYHEITIAVLNEISAVTAVSVIFNMLLQIVHTN